LFWQAAVRQAEMIKPDIVHCHDLDTLFAGVMYQRRTGVKLIYDAHENYPAMMTLYLPGIFTQLLERFEQKITWNADALIAASKEMAVVLKGMTDAPIEVIGNYPSRSAYSQVTEDQIKAKRESLSIHQDDLVVGYIGGFTKNRVIMPLIEAVSNMLGVHLVIAGDGVQREAIEHRIQNVKNIHYLGWTAPLLVPLVTSLCDILYYVLEPKYPGVIYNAPNSLANAMAAGKPIIANRVGDLGSIVDESKCGILLKDITPTHIRDALDMLGDKSLREKLGMAGKWAFEQQYNWDLAQKKLIQLYEYVEQL
jgi:glycosyltransferase involved in cell wall biosynthesis